MNRCCRYRLRLLVDELLDVAAAMADGSYYQTRKDDQIEWCGQGGPNEVWSGGEGE